MIGRAARVSLLSALVASCTLKPASEDVLRAATARQDPQGLVHVAPGSAADQQAMAEPALAPAPPAAAVIDDHRPMAAEFDILSTHTLSGNWILTHPTRVMVNSGGDATYGNVRRYVCRFEQSGDAIGGSCVPGGKEVSGRLSGDQLKLGWSRGLISARINGVLSSASHFEGGLSLGMIGLQMTSDVPAHGDKLVVNPAAEFSRQRAILVDELAAHHGPTASEWRDLGDVTTISFLAEIAMPAEESQPEGQISVFDVEFAKGWRLCGVRLDAAQNLEILDCR